MHGPRSASPEGVTRFRSPLRSRRRSWGIGTTRPIAYVTLKSRRGHSARSANLSADRIDTSLTLLNTAASLLRSGGDFTPLLRMVSRAPLLSPGESSLLLFLTHLLESAMSKSLKLIVASFMLAVVAISSGCYSYGGVAAPDENTVVVSRNSAFLSFIFPREMYVCKVTDKGLRNCSAQESP